MNGTSNADEIEAEQDYSNCSKTVDKILEDSAADVYEAVEVNSRGVKIKSSGGAASDQERNEIELEVGKSNVLEKTVKVERKLIGHHVIPHLTPDLESFSTEKTVEDQISNVTSSPVSCQELPGIGIKSTCPHHVCPILTVS